MKCGIIYFSATGNTAYVAKLFKSTLAQYEINCDLIEIDKIIKFKDQYDMYVLGSPIYCETYPKYFIDFILSHLIIGKGRKVILYSTQAAKKASGAKILGDKLSNVGFKIYGEICFRMPNNYYFNFFPKTTEEDGKKHIKETSERVHLVVTNFINGKRTIDYINKGNVKLAKLSYPIFQHFAYKWAKKNFKVDETRCVKCGKCVKDCPTENIKLENKNVSFNSHCISCVRCFHRCPFNAIMYKEKHFEQYKKIPNSN